ncbi:hypothetical protein WP4S18E09_P10040 (plasmid) [Escherichia coli]|nr:hypothetical protein WP4S18E07_P60040 [Escherichia coli]BBS00763.1 hypothetical protein WP4S18E09_P10040 [Escherichia coli]
MLNIDLCYVCVLLVFIPSDEHQKHSMMLCREKYAVRIGSVK